MKTKNSLYLVLTIIFVILSVIGIYFLYQIINNNQKNNSTSNTSNTQATITSVPTTSNIVVANPTIATESSVASDSAKTTLTPTKIPSPTPTLVLTTFKSDDDGFSAEYSVKRKLYQDTESSGNRYTFYLDSGNFAVHVAFDDQWAWVNPSREFDSDFTVADQDSFVYETSTQKIVDFQSDDKNYTIQCIHNGLESLKSECEEFIQNFQLL